MKRGRKKFVKTSLELRPQTHAQANQLAEALGVSKTAIFGLAVRRMWQSEFGRPWPHEKESKLNGDGHTRVQS